MPCCWFFIDSHAQQGILHANRGKGGGGGWSAIVREEEVDWRCAFRLEK